MKNNIENKTTIKSNTKLSKNKTQMRKNLAQIFTDPTELRVGIVIFQNVPNDTTNTPFGKTPSAILRDSIPTLQQLADKSLISVEVISGLEDYCTEQRILERLQEAGLIFLFAKFAPWFGGEPLYERPPFYYEVMEQADHSTIHIPYRVE